MSPTVLNLGSSPRGPLRVQREGDSSNPVDVASMEANSDRPEIQTKIREAIRRGVIRVLPVRGQPDRIKIVPTLPAKKGQSPVPND